MTVTYSMLVYLICVVLVWVGDVADARTYTVDVDFLRPEDVVDSSAMTRAVSSASVAVGRGMSVGVTRAAPELDGDAAAPFGIEMTWGSLAVGGSGDAPAATGSLLGRFWTAEVTAGASGKLVSTAGDGVGAGIAAMFSNCIYSLG